MPTPKQIGGSTVTDSDPLQTTMSSLPADPLGASADAAVTTDTTGTISGKLRGLIKHAYERMPASLGQKTMANSLPVALPSDQSSIPVAGDVAGGATDSGNPVKIGGIGKTTNPTAVTDGQRVGALFDKLGRQIVALGAPRELRGSQRSTAITDTTETTFITAAASVYHDLRGLLIANDSTTDVRVDIRDDTGGTVILSFSVKAGTTSGAMLPQSTPQTAVNKNWTAKCSASPAGGNAQVFVTGFYETTV